MMGCAKLLSIRGDRGSIPPSPPPIPPPSCQTVNSSVSIWVSSSDQWSAHSSPPLFAHPCASSLSSRQTSPAPSSPWSSSSLLLYNPAIPHRDQRRRKAALVHRFTMSGASTHFLRRHTECVCVCVCQQCLDEGELSSKSQILSLKMNHCVCFVV